MLRRSLLVGGLVLAAMVGLGIIVFGCSDTPGVKLVQPIGNVGCVSATGTGGACTRASALVMPQALVVSPDAKHLYVASLSARRGGVAIFARDAATGTLTQTRGEPGCISEARGPCRQANAMKGARDLAISPDGRNVYVAALSSDAVAVLDRDPASGALRQKPGRVGCVSKSGSKGACVRGRALDAPVGIAISPDGRSVYATSYGDNAIVVFDRNPAGGGLTQKAGTAGCLVGGLSRARGCRRAPVGVGPVGDVAISPDGRHVYTDVIFDRAAGGELTARTGRSGAATNGYPRFSADGKHAYDSSFLQVFARNAEDGSVRSIECFLPEGGQGCSRPHGLHDPVADVALSPDGGNVYVGSQDKEGDDVLAIFDRDAASGKLTQGTLPGACVSAAGSGGCARGRLLTDPNPSYNSELSIAVSPDSRSVYVAGDTVAVFQRQ